MHVLLKAVPAHTAPGIVVTEVAARRIRLLNVQRVVLQEYPPPHALTPIRKRAVCDVGRHKQHHIAGLDARVDQHHHLDRRRRYAYVWAYFDLTRSLEFSHVHAEFLARSTI